MKKILIIRSANVKVINDLIDNINQKYKSEKINLYMLIQKGSVNFFKDKYKDIIYIEKEDGNFNYSKIKKDKILWGYLKKQNFDTVYIPSSNINFKNFNETFLISSSLNANKYMLFNSLREQEEVKLRKVFIFLDKYCGDSFYMIKAFFLLILLSIYYIVYLLYYKIKQINEN